MLVGRVGEVRVSLQRAISGMDGERVVVALSTGSWDDLLELAGDGLLIALAQRIEGVLVLARRCARQLRKRAWEGDRDLAEQLDGSPGDRPIPMLRPLLVSLEELADVLEGDPVYGGGRIDLRTGDVWPRAAIECAREVGEEDLDDEDSERWLAVWCEGSRAAYRDMEDFIEETSDRDQAERLSIAISGPGAFRRFKDVLKRWPDELETWHTFSNERQRGRARAWLASEGYSPRVPGRPTST